MADYKDELIALLKKNNDALQAENDLLNQKIIKQTEMLTSQSKQIDELTKRITNLLDLMSTMKKELYGSKSEHRKKDVEMDGQYSFFNETEFCADPKAEEPPAKEMVSGYMRGKNRKSKRTKDELYDSIPVHKEYLEAESDICPVCGSKMKSIGYSYAYEELQIIPAQVVRVQYYKESYKCPHCSTDEKAKIISAPVPARLIPHSFAASSTVAWIMVQKYVNMVPLYRQEQAWKQEGVILHRNTMANWIIFTADHYLKPIYDRMHELLIQRDVLHADETPCQVLREEGRRAQQKSYMWTYLAVDDDEQPNIVLYDYRPGRSGDYAKEFLKGFKGYCHVDGYQGYNKVDDLIRVGCMAHCRRYFYQAIPSGQSQSDKGPAQKGYAYTNKLFEIERDLKDLAPDKRKNERLEREEHVLDEFFAWVKTVNPVKGSRLDKAVTYAIKQEDNLRNYLKDGRLQLSNNAAEIRIKSYVMGRKNFLFHDTPAGATASAVVYSLIETAKANNVNVFQYLMQVFLYMPGYEEGSASVDVEDMLPWSDFMKEQLDRMEKAKREKLEADP